MFDPLTGAAIALKTSLLLVGVGLISLCIRRQSAAWRHLLWTSALALSLLMPMTVAYLPSYLQISLPQAAEPWVRDEAAPIANGVQRADEVAQAPGPRQAGLAGTGREIRAAWPTAAIVWLTGALGAMLWNAMAHIGLMRWVRKSRPDLAPAWAATLRRVTSESKFRRHLRVLESDQATSPCTWGLLRPVLLLPAAGADWPEPQRRYALLHELAHVRRGDYFTAQIASFACAMHWYSPFVWFAAARARKLQEQACDDAVLQAGGAPSDYAQFLVSIADGSWRPSLPFPVAVGMVQRTQLHGRVTAILDASRARLPLSSLALFVAIAPLTCLALFLATVSAVASPLPLQPGTPLAASFSSVELRNGGEVNLIHGLPQRVTLLEGDPDESSITIRDDGRLVIDRCPRRCPRRHDFVVEIVAPALAAIAVSEGGTIQSDGDFPRQPQIEAAVSQGGTIDIRSMAVANIAASVYSGGRIFVKPAVALSANVEQGGNVTYWGDAVVKSSIRHGGVVVKGEATDADRLLAELAPEMLPPLSPVPPIPAVSPAPQAPAVRHDSR